MRGSCLSARTTGSAPVANAPKGASPPHAAATLLPPSMPGAARGQAVLLACCRWQLPQPLSSVSQVPLRLD